MSDPPRKNVERSIRRLMAGGETLRTIVFIFEIYLKFRYTRERERERFVLRQLDPSRGIRRSSIRRRHVAPSTGRLYLSICIFLTYLTYFIT